MAYSDVCALAHTYAENCEPLSSLVCSYPTIKVSLLTWITDLSAMYACLSVLNIFIGRNAGRNESVMKNRAGRCLSALLLLYFSMIHFRQQVVRSSSPTEAS